MIYISELEIVINFYLHTNISKYQMHKTVYITFFVNIVSSIFKLTSNIDRLKKKPILSGTALFSAHRR